MRWLLLTLFLGFCKVCPGQTKTIKQSIDVEKDAVYISGASIKEESCIDGPGEIDITVEGGSGNYGFSWAGPFGFSSGNEDIDNLVEGDYEVTITDIVNGCSHTETYSVAYYCPYTGCTDTFTLLSTIDTGCLSFAGAASFEVGISGDYNYTVIKRNLLTNTEVEVINGSSSGPEILAITNLEHGSYTIEVSDAGGNCSYSEFFKIQSIDFSFTAISFANNIQCISTPTGSINLEISNSLAPSDYEIRYRNIFTGVTSTITVSNDSESINNLKRGFYGLEVENINAGCIIQESGLINNTESLTISGTTLPQTVCSTPDGSIDITVLGGSSDYTYLWSTGTSTQDISNNSFGFYSVSVVDNISGCTAFNSFNITDARVKPNVSFTITDNTSCQAPFNGSISLVTSGSPGPFNYFWLKEGEGSPIATTPNISGLAPGIYGLNITDITTGCTTQVFPDETGLEVEDDSEPEIDISVNQLVANSACFGLNNGIIEVSIDITPSQPYTISWTGPNGFTEGNIEILTGLEHGEYFLTLETTCQANEPPVIEANTILPAPQGSNLTFNLLSIISDPNNNLDPSTISIIEQPISGATATVDFVSVDVVNLEIDYTGVIFSGTDQLRIRVFDLLGLSAEQNIFITGLNLTGELVIYNAVAREGSPENQYLKIDNLTSPDNLVIIYNRWGDEVFRVQGYDNALKGRRFEGINKNGNKLPPGNYFYEIRLLDSAPRTIRGYLSLK